MLEEEKPATRVNTESLHAVGKWEVQQVKASKLKLCENLKIEPRRLQNGRQVFVPRCTAESFEWRGYRPNNESQETHTLANFLHDDVVQCPIDCLNYESSLKASWVRAFKRTASLLKYSVVPFRWFSALPWQTQILILLLVILLVAPRWVPQIIALLKAAYGK